MSNNPEKRLIEALRKVDVHGDVAPPKYRRQKDIQSVLSSL